MEFRHVALVVADIACVVVLLRGALYGAGVAHEVYHAGSSARGIPFAEELPSFTVITGLTGFVRINGDVWVGESKT